MSLALSIDNYLRGRGSPMAGLGNVFVQAGRNYGIDPRLLVGIGVIESSAGKALAEPYNFANWGVHRGQRYPNFNAAINDLARGLRSGYLDEGLATPQAIVSKYAPASDGNDESNWANVVSQVMKQLGAKGLVSETVAKPVQETVASVAKTAQLPKMPTLPRVPTPIYDPLKFATGLQQQFLAGGGSVDLTQVLPRLQAESWSLMLPPPPPKTKLPPVPKGAKVPGAPQRTPAGTPPPGGVTTENILPSSFKVTHRTSGAEQYGATDWFRPAGTVFGAPVAGKIYNIHGTPGSRGKGIYGYIAYLKGDNGVTYFLTHFDNVYVKEGQRVERGTPIGTVAPYGNASHIHIGASNR